MFVPSTVWMQSWILSSASRLYKFYCILTLSLSLINIFYKLFGTSALNPGAWFLPIFTVCFWKVRLSYLRVNDCPAGLEPTAGARKRRQASVTNRRNTAPGFNKLDSIILLLIHNVLRFLHCCIANYGHTLLTRIIIGDHENTNPDLF